MPSGVNITFLITVLLVFTGTGLLTMRRIIWPCRSFTSFSTVGLTSRSCVISTGSTMISSCISVFALGSFKVVFSSGRFVVTSFILLITLVTNPKRSCSSFNNTSGLSSVDDSSRGIISPSSKTGISSSGMTSALSSNSSSVPSGFNLTVIFTTVFVLIEWVFL